MERQGDESPAFDFDAMAEADEAAEANGRRDTRGVRVGTRERPARGVRRYDGSFRSSSGKQSSKNAATLGRYEIRGNLGRLRATY